MKKIRLGIMACAAVTALSTQAALVAYWDFEGDTQEGVTSTTGTLSGDAAVSGTAIAPNSGNSFTTATGNFNTTMNAGAITGFGGSGSFTVLTWLQTTGTSDQTIFGYSPSGGNTGGADLRLFAQGNGNIRVEMSAGAGFEADLGTLNLNDGATHMVGIVFNSGTGDSFQDLDLYVDGTLYDVTGGTDHTVNILATGDNIVFGNGGGGNPRPFAGTLDDMAIYDTALTGAEFSDIAVNGIPEPATLGMVSMFGGAILFIRRKLAI